MIERTASIDVSLSSGLLPSWMPRVSRIEMVPRSEV
jgi:hypothetical protein